MKTNKGKWFTIGLCTLWLIVGFAMIGHKMDETTPGTEAPFSVAIVILPIAFSAYFWGKNSANKGKQTHNEEISGQSRKHILNVPIQLDVRLANDSHPADNTLPQTTQDHRRRQAEPTGKDAQNDFSNAAIDDSRYMPKG